MPTVTRFIKTKLCVKSAVVYASVTRIRDNVQSTYQHSTLSDQLYILSDRDRRRVLFALLAAESDDEVDLPAVERDDEDVSMQHVHLPKLADAGFVDWDRETGAVARGPAFDEVAPLLETLAGHRDEGRRRHDDR